MTPSNRRRPLSLLLLAGALVLASTGGAVAGSMITGAQIKDGTVTGADVRNRSLGPAELSGAAVRRLEPARIPSRTTVRGVWTASGDYPENGAALQVGVSLPRPAPRSIAVTDVLIDSAGDDASCTGTTTRPTAPRGKVCVYGELNASVAYVRQAYGTLGEVANPYGFFLAVQGTGTYANVTMSGTWAYTAP